MRFLLIAMLLFFGCDSDSPSSPSPILGCMDSTACNYDEFATVQSECVYDIDECLEGIWIRTVVNEYSDEECSVPYVLEDNNPCNYEVVTYDEPPTYIAYLMFLNQTNYVRYSLRIDVNTIEYNYSTVPENENCSENSWNQCHIAIDNSTQIIFAEGLYSAEDDNISFTENLSTIFRNGNDNICYDL